MNPKRFLEVLIALGYPDDSREWSYEEVVDFADALIRLASVDPVTIRRTILTNALKSALKSDVQQERWFYEPVWCECGIKDIRKNLFLLAGEWCCQRCAAKSPNYRLCGICDNVIQYADMELGRLQSEFCPICYHKFGKEIRRVEAAKVTARKAGNDASLSVQDWLSTIEFFGKACAYCGDDYTDLEHVVPISLGGGTTFGNCVPACGRCNSVKRSRHPVLDRGVLQSRFGPERLNKVLQFAQLDGVPV